MGKGSHSGHPAPTQVGRGKGADERISFFPFFISLGVFSGGKERNRSSPGFFPF